MEKKEEKIFRDIVKILEQDVPQEALAEGNPTPEQEAIALIKQELDKAREEVRREYAHELLDDYYDPDRDSVEIDIDVLQKEFDLISNSEITSKQRQTEEILEEGYRIMAEDEARMKDEIALETYKQATTEKQEEWREELAELLVGSRHNFTLREQLEGFISQLLSEEYKRGYKKAIYKCAMDLKKENEKVLDYMENLFSEKQLSKLKEEENE